MIQRNKKLKLNKIEGDAKSFKYGDKYYKLVPAQVRRTCLGCAFALGFADQTEEELTACDQMINEFDCSDNDMSDNDMIIEEVTDELYIELLKLKEIERNKVKQRKAKRDRTRAKRNKN